MARAFSGIGNAATLRRPSGTGVTRVARERD
jgi:hypothetical protein